MSISSISSNLVSNLTGPWQNTAAQRKQDFSELASDLQSGNLAGA